MRRRRNKDDGGRGQQKMNLCDVYIEKIIEVRTYDNYVIAILDTDCWGCKRKGERVFFSKEEWEKAKKDGKYLA